MAQVTKIAWTDATFNPWRGCVKVSEGCAHCYAEGWAKRTGKDIWGKDAKREHASTAYWKQPVKWNKEAAMTGKPFRVFCASLADVCEDRPDLVEPREQLKKLIVTTPHLTWLLCTKRPENFLRLFWGSGAFTRWPRNVWAMTTAENQAQADQRLPHLIRVPAVIRGVSYEPALGPVSFEHFLPGKGFPVTDDMHDAPDGAQLGRYERVGNHWEPVLPPVDWIIFGGESGGNGARPCDRNWGRSVIDQCRRSGAVPFIKQLGFDSTENGHRTNDLTDAKGGNPEEWPEDLQVREFPVVKPLAMVRP